MIEFELSEARRTRPNMEERSQQLPRPTTAARVCGTRISVEASRKATTKVEGGGPVRCTGRQCRSCTGGAVADCVAICCCPCAVLNCLALAFVKIPFLIGKRWCLGFRRKRKKKKGRNRDSAEGGDGNAVTKEGNDGGGGSIDSWFEIGFEEGSIGEKLEGCGETEKVWVELCEFDHLNFGRVSFAGIPLQSYNN